MKVLSTLGTEIADAVTSHLLPELARVFSLSVSHLAIQDMFIAKYCTAPGGLRELEPHEDGSEFSFVLALNKVRPLVYVIRPVMLVTRRRATSERSTSAVAPNSLPSMVSQFFAQNAALQPCSRAKIDTVAWRLQRVRVIY